MQTRNLIIISIFASWIIGIAAAINPAEMKEDGQEYQKAYGLILNKQWEEAEKIFKNIIADYPNGSWVDDSRFWLCYALEKKGAEPDEAFDCYQSFIDDYRNSKWVDDAKSNMIRLAKELDDLGKTEYTAIVESMKKNEKEEITVAAIQALQGRIDEKSFETLSRLYNQSDKLSVKKKIIYVFGTFDSERANKKLRDIVKNEKEILLRSEAVFWIGQQSDSEETVNLLKDIINNDPEYAVRKKAVFSLAQSEHKSAYKSLIDIARNNDNDNIRAEAVFWLSQGDGSDETLDLLKDLIFNDKEQKVRRRALFALSQFEDGKGLPTLIKIAKESKDDDLRAVAVSWIGQSANNAEALEVLKDLALNDTNIKVQKKAIFAISQLDSKQSFPVMKSIAKNHPQVEMRKQAVFWIGQIKGNPEVLGFLEDIVYNDPNSGVKEKAIFGIGLFSGKEKNDDVLRFLKKIVYADLDTGVKEKAIFAIGQLSKPGSIETLIEIAQNHPNLSIRKKAIFWLGQSEDDKAKEALEQVLFNE